MTDYLKLFRDISTKGSCYDSYETQADPNKVAKVAIVAGGIKEKGTPGHPAGTPDPFADLPPNDPAYVHEWRRWYALLLRHHWRRHPDLAWFLAYGDAVNLWHAAYGAKPSATHCAGCGVLLVPPVETMPDGARLHAQDPCLIRYGERWRGAAAVGLAAVGVLPRPEYEARTATETGTDSDAKGQSCKMEAADR